MNLSTMWIEVFEREGFEASHRSSVGSPRAPDSEVLDGARSNGFILFTHDLDFGAILAASGANRPSVIQIRAQDVTPGRFASTLVSTIRDLRKYLESGALVSLDATSRRTRILPLRH
jgi:predicted nuclease of predicted toxin-antitoxin system